MALTASIDWITWLDLILLQFGTSFIDRGNRQVVMGYKTSGSMSNMHDSIVLFFLGPTFTVVLLSILFNDPFTVFDGFCSVLCVVGVVLLSQPHHLFGKQTISSPEQENDRKRTMAIVCALLGALMSAAAYVVVRKVGKGIHFMVHVFYTGVVTALVSPLVFFFLLQQTIPPVEEYATREWTQLALVGLLAFLGQCLLHQG